MKSGYDIHFASSSKSNEDNFRLMIAAYVVGGETTRTAWAAVTRNVLAAHSSHFCRSWKLRLWRRRLPSSMSADGAARPLRV